MLRNNQKGQISLIILLVMVVVLSLGLSVISHSITDISISEDEKESMRAFSAAEAGIEDALRQPDLSVWVTSPPSPIPVADGLTAKVVVSEQNDIQRSIGQNEFIDVKLNGPTDLTINWDSGVALEIIIYDNDGTTVQRFAYNHGASCVQGFVEVASGSVTIGAADMPANAILARIRALCGETAIGVTANPPLPLQGYVIDSRAVVGEAKKSKTSAIEVSRTVSALPPIFDYVLFSGGGLN